MKIKQLYCVLVFYAGFTTFYSCSGETKKEIIKEKRQDTVAVTEISLSVENTDLFYELSTSKLNEFDFRNFIYVSDGDTMAVTNGENYQNDSTGFDSVFICNENYEVVLMQKETKTIELERHYRHDGYGSSGKVNYIFVFQKPGDSLVCTGRLKYHPVKRSKFEGLQDVIYPRLKNRNNESTGVKTFLEYHEGDIVVVKSMYENE